MTLEVPASASDAGGGAVGDRTIGAARTLDTTERAARVKTTRVVSADVSVWKRVAEIWSSRELLLYLVRTEIKVKYKNSILGLIWSMISPAVTLVVYFVVFQYIAKNGVPNFAIFLFAGLLVWNLFQVGVMGGTATVVSNSGLVKKVSFPREILALASVGSSTVFFFFQACVMVIFLIAFHSSPAWSYLPLVPLALLALLVLCAALSVLLSAVNVYLRDTQHLVEVILTAWFWACPIVYAYGSQIGNKLSAHGIPGWLYFVNPITPLVVSFQRALYAHVTVHDTIGGALMSILPPNGMLWYVEIDLAVLGFAVVFFFVALMIFGRLEGNFAEEL